MIDLKYHHVVAIAKLMDMGGHWSSTDANITEREN